MGDKSTVAKDRGKIQHLNDVYVFELTAVAVAVRSALSVQPEQCEKQCEEQCEEEDTLMEEDVAAVGTAAGVGVVQWRMPLCSGTAPGRRAGHTATPFGPQVREREGEGELCWLMSSERRG